VATALVVFTRDLRVRDNPALSRACATADAVVPLFVYDDAMPIAASANRKQFLADSLFDLDRSLQERGGRLVTRRGRWVETVLSTARRLDVAEIHLADDVSAWSQRRVSRLRREAGSTVEIRNHEGVTVVAPGAVTPSSGGGAFSVFTPYHRRWLAAEWRRPLPAPGRIVLPDLSPLGRLDERNGGERRATAADLLPGGESAGLRRLRAWAGDHLADYADAHDDLPADATSRLSAYLHFGCLSPGEVAVRLRERDGAAPFVRQLCWRDFFHQLLADRPDAARHDYRSRGDRWNDDPEALEAWRTGRTGYPLVDAAMRQLVGEGFVPNRVRMVVASFLTKDLYLDWRLGADHFMDHLVDGDVANNQLNWQWVAGTGTDANRHRVFNPVTQSRRFDPAGDYIRRYVPELADVAAPGVHWPDAEVRRRCGYPAPIVDHAEAIAAFRAATP
jgi:deoxyribodipyrimidine photo-lyase